MRRAPRPSNLETVGSKRYAQSFLYGATAAPGIDRGRRTRIKRNAVILIGMGLVVVYGEAGAGYIAGVTVTLTGMAMLVALLLGWFDREQHQVDMVVHAIEQARYDEATLTQLWEDALANVARSHDPSAVVVMRAIELVRERLSVQE